MIVLTALDYRWVIFIVVASIVLAILLFLAFYLPLHSHHKKKKFQEYYYKKINSIVHEFDYYLINNFVFKVENGKLAHVDHIIFAEKYIYLIFDYYYDGDLQGNIEDKSLIYFFLFFIKSNFCLFFFPCFFFFTLLFREIFAVIR